MERKWLWPIPRHCTENLDGGSDQNLKSLVLCTRLEPDTVTMMSRMSVFKLTGVSKAASIADKFCTTQPAVLSEVLEISVIRL
jgi:hypothetical protein